MVSYSIQHVDLVLLVRFFWKYFVISGGVEHDSASFNFVFRFFIDTLIIIIVILSVYMFCICVCTALVSLVPREAREGLQIPWNWS